MTTLALQPGTPTTSSPAPARGSSTATPCAARGSSGRRTAAPTGHRSNSPPTARRATSTTSTRSSSTTRARRFAATGTGVYRSTNGGAFAGTRSRPTGGGLTGASLAGGCLDLAMRTDQARPSSPPAAPWRPGARVYRGRRTPPRGRAGAQLDELRPLPRRQRIWPSATSLTEARMGRTSLAIAPSDQDVIYAVAADNQTDALWSVYYSADGGASWETRAPVTSLGTRASCSSPTRRSPGPAPASGAATFYNQGWYDNAVAVDPIEPGCRLGRGHRSLPLGRRRPRLRAGVVLVGRPERVGLHPCRPARDRVPPELRRRRQPAGLLRERRRDLQVRQPQRRGGHRQQRVLRVGEQRSLREPQQRLRGHAVLLRHRLPR